MSYATKAELTEAKKVLNERITSLAVRTLALETQVAALESSPAPEPSTSFIVGLDAANWGANTALDVKGAVSHARIDSELGASTIDQYKAAGLTMNLLFAGPYNSGGLVALNADQWVSNALSFYRANLTPSQAPYVEILNEPFGSWFWGSGATTSANQAAYRTLLQKAHAAFQGPKILAAFESSANWWTPECANFVDGIVVHAYGGTGSRSTSALGNRKLIEEAHAITGKDIYVTEIGWPTAVGKPNTPDSLQWTEAEQATNIQNFLAWAKGTGYVRQVIVFQHHDYGSSSANTKYGVVRDDGTHKPSYAVLAQ